MAKQKNYGAMIRALTGMSKEQYKKAYRKFATRVRNYNTVSGTNYSAVREFYYSFKYADNPSPALLAIEETAATRPHGRGMPALTGEALKKTEEMSTDVLLKKWAGFIASSKEAREMGFGGMAIDVAEKLKRGEITAKQANEALKEIARERDKRRDNDPAYRY